MFFGKRSKLFLSASYTLDIPLGSKLEYGSGNNTTEVKCGSNGNFAFGIGFKYNDKIEIEARYLGKREFFGNAAFASYFSDYSGFSVILGYTIY